MMKLNHLIGIFSIGLFFSLISADLSANFDVLGSAAYEGVRDNGEINYEFGQPLEIHGENLYVGGLFRLAGAKYSAGIASYNSRTKAWKSLSSNQERLDFVETAYYHPYHDLLLIGGGFNAINGTLCPNFCAYYEAADSWQWFGQFNYTVRAITGVPTNSTFFVAGDFVTVSGVSARRVVMWNGNNYVSMGQGFNNSVRALVYSATSGKLYAGGTFGTPSGYPNRLAVWTGSIWDYLQGSSSSPNGDVYSLFVVGSSILIAGAFSTAGGISSESVAVFNGVSYQGIGTGLAGYANSIVFDSSRNMYYASGEFVIGTTQCSIAYASASNNTWYPLLNKYKFDDSVYSLSINSTSKELYFGGYFTRLNVSSNNPICASSMGRFSWNYTTTISPTPLTPTFVWNDVVDGGIKGVVSTMATTINSSFLLAGGSFARFGNTLGVAQGVVYSVSGGDWRQAGPNTFNGTVFAIIRETNTTFIVAGKNLGSSTPSASRTLLRYSIITNLFVNFDGASPFANGTVYALARNSSNGAIFAGGNFNYGSNIVSMGYYLSNAWSPMSSVAGRTACSTNATIFALAIDSSNTVLYVGGFFTGCGPISTSQFISGRNLARYLNGEWSSMPSNSHPTGPVYSLMFVGLRVYIGGDFQNVSGFPMVKNVFSFNHTSNTFTALGPGLSNTVNSLTYDPISDVIVAGGSFVHPDLSGNMARGIAYFNGTGWVGLANANNQISMVFMNGSNLLASGKDVSKIHGSCLGNFGITLLPTSFTPAPTPIPTPEPSPPTPDPTPEPTPEGQTPSPTPEPTPEGATPQPTPLVPTTIPGPTLAPSPTPDSGNSIQSSSVGSSTSIIIGVVCAVVLCILIIVVLLLLLVVVRRRKNSKKESENKPLDVDLQSTHNLSNSNQSIRTNTYDALPESNSSTPTQTNHASMKNNDYVTTAGRQQSSRYDSVPIITGITAAPAVNQYQSGKNQYQTVGVAEKMALSSSLQQLNVPFESLQILQQLGKGNFGIVNLAKYKGQFVAVKQLKEELGSDAASASDALRKYSKSLQEFVTEAKLLSQIPPSPFVISLIGICPDPFCILTEYLDGGSLISYLQKPIPLQSEVLTQFLKDILMGVAHLHANGIIHRDLAARNVLLRIDASNPENAPQCVLTDMGLARLYDRETTYQKTKSATFPLKWSAPELLRDKKSSEKSDIWSFGVISIEIFSRNIPFTEFTPMNYAMAMVSGQFTPSANENTPEFLKPIINQCFSREAKNRPSAQEIIQQWS